MKTKTIALSTFVILAILTATTVSFADDDYIERRLQQNAKVSHEQAQTLAVKAVGGGEIVDMDFDVGLRGAYYEAEVIHNNTKYDVKIDASTGKLLGKYIEY